MGLLRNTPTALERKGGSGESHAMPRKVLAICDGVMKPWRGRMRAARPTSIAGRVYTHLSSIADVGEEWLAASSRAEHLEGTTGNGGAGLWGMRDSKT
jgi:hypothetical protein